MNMLHYIQGDSSGDGQDQEGGEALDREGQAD